MQTPPSNYLKFIEFETYHIKLFYPLFFPPTKYVMVLQHGPFSFHTMREGPWLHKTTFPTPMVQPLDEIEGSLPLQGPAFWLVCEVALSLTNLFKRESRVLNGSYFPPLLRSF